VKRLSRMAATAVVSGAVATGLMLGAGAASAQGPNSPTPNFWCPGQGIPFNGMQWDEGVCHTWYIVPAGTGNVTMLDLQGNPLDSWVLADAPPPVFAPPPPPAGPPPGTPFCSPRGALIIIPPICDEIGVDWPPGSVRH
jgi:hypothetical protein